MVNDKNGVAVHTYGRDNQRGYGGSQSRVGGTGKDQRVELQRERDSQNDKVEREHRSSLVHDCRRSVR